ncbi:MAG: aminopeptidase P family protein [Kiritimatiellia bacterium]
MVDKSITVSENIRNLRRLMKQSRLDAYIVPSADPHQTECVHPHWRCRAWLSGFTGSAGTLAVLENKAGLWTDGRYFIQAERELAGSGIDLFRMQMDGVPEIIDWICENLPEDGAVGVDGRLITAKQGDEWSDRLAVINACLVITEDLVSPLWKNRPALSSAPARLLSETFAGRSVADKLSEIRDAMAEEGADIYLISSLYDINWLFNIRGNDTEYTPLLTAYALVYKRKAELFADCSKFSENIMEKLSASGVAVMPYDGIIDTLKSLSGDTEVYFCDERVNMLISENIFCDVITGKELTALPKARKNAVELKNWERVHEIDGAAMVRFWMWLETAVASGNLSEVDAADELRRIRLSHPDCLDLSFASISAYGSNAAMMHYSAEPGSCATVRPEGLFLIDSGGQYYGGTTDITRTIAMGELTDEQKMDYTLTLKGLIALSSVRFLKGARGVNLDVLARRPLWEYGLDYKCGTGHGVGCYLNVHEGPHNISQSVKSDTPLEPGMVVTIEPGVYKENKYGIRIENMVVVEADCETECGTFYRFRTQTLCPIDMTPLKMDIMSDQEISWLNTYHQSVVRRLADLLSEEEYAWIKKKCADAELQNPGNSIGGSRK